MKFHNTVFRNALLFFSVAVFLTGGAAAVRGQSALDGFDPNANGTVEVVAVQPDGKILIGGDFTIVQGITRNRIARLNADGTLDQLFDPNANGYVHTIAVQADGKVLVGGSFNGANSIGGTNRNRIVRLDGTTGQADSFNPNADNTVYTIAVQADGKILAGGGFTSIGGQTRNRMARLDSTTGLADSLDAAVIGFAVNVIVVQADGRILVGGTFGSIGGQSRTHIARLDATTGLADSFNPIATAGFFAVTAIAVQADGKILAGGTFTTISGTNRNSIARLDATTGLADSFNPNANNIVRSIVVQPDGKILAGGDFSNIGGQTRNRIARLDAITGVADSFDPNASAPANVNSIAVQADGKILAGGSFTNFTPNGGATVTRNNIARLETDGRLDRTLNLNLLYPIAGDVRATAIQPDGKILVGGDFTNVLGVALKKNVRLNPDGSVDTAFDPNVDFIFLIKPVTMNSLVVQTDGKILAGGTFLNIGGQRRITYARLEAGTGLADMNFNPNADGSVYPSVVLADGKILVGGVFSTIGGQPRTRIARLNPDGTADTNFNPNANGFVQTIAVQADGKILVGGEFTIIGGQPRNHIARLDAITGMADSFNPNANTNVTSIAVQADGKILVGGDFNGTNSIGGATRNYIARLDATSGLADSFNPNASYRVYSIAVQSDGKVLVGGGFSSIGGQLRKFIARLDATDGFADSFDPNANSYVLSITVQADGKILAGGGFDGMNSIGGQSRKFFARLSNDTVAHQSLGVTQTTILWTRGGSSPQFMRVTFESSTDNVNYTPLGNGTKAGSNWTLTGLSLPTGQNLYIRARGFYAGGYLNNSGSIQESVRNVFLTPLPRLNIQRSANTNIVLSWATNFTGLTLESKTNLNTNVWSVVSPAPAVSGTNNVVTNAIGGSTRFYRLRQ